MQQPMAFCPLFCGSPGLQLCHASLTASLREGRLLQAQDSSFRGQSRGQTRQRTGHAGRNGSLALCLSDSSVL